MPLAMSLADSKTLLLGAAVVGVPSALWILSRSRRPSGNSDCSDFSSFLKQPGQPQPSLPPQSCCTSFESFLKTGNQQQEQQGASGPSAVDGSAGVAAGPAAVPLDRAPVTVLFGTEYGFSKEIAEKLAERIKATGQFWPRLLDMADHPQGLPLSRHQALLVVCSTQGDGVPPAEARDFCEWLHSGAPAAGGPLAGLAYSVCALGDKSYQHYCRCGRQLDARLRELGAAQLHGRADINREDWKAVEAWMEGVLGALPTLGLRTAEELGELEGDEGTGPGHATKRWSKARPYFGTVTALEGLCNITGKDDKNTFRVEIDLGDSGLEYIPGDALGIWPHNCPEAVDELLAMLGAEPGLLVQVPSWHYQDPEVGEGRTTMALRDALTKCYDLRCPKPELLRLLLDLLCAKQDGLPKPPRPTTNGHAATRAGGATAGKAAPGGKRSSSDGAGAKENAGGGGGKAAQQTQQPKTAVNGAVTNGTTAANGVAANGVHHQALCADGCIVDKLERLAALVADGSAAAAYLEPRHVIDVLADFAPARPSVGALLSMLRPLQPRLYSISSSQREAQHSVQATVAVVRYASLGKDRKGVASTFLGERLELGQQVPIYIHKNPDFRLPRDHSTPIVMVGPGTGLAPFRSFMQERLLACQESGQALGPCVLYFGCRRRDQDYLYGPLLEAWAAEGTLRLFTAFSREQAGPKMYVQNRLRESGPLVWELLQAGGHFYVCGDAANMAGQVEEVLLEVIAQQGGREPQQAQQYLDDLAAAGRYQRDVWF